MSGGTSPVILYTSDFCGHANRVERFLREQNVAVHVINISSEPGAREQLIELNEGYASVPTLLFPDGARLVEPSLGLLFEELVRQSLVDEEAPAT